MINIKKFLAYKIKELYEIGFNRREKQIVDSVLSSRDFGQTIANATPTQINKIAFIVPGIEKFSGGITSILRLGTYLIDAGYDVDMIDFTGETEKELFRNARYNLPSVKTKILTLSTAKDEYDVVIAGNWQAVYFLNNFHAYKMYFVQDFEPYFFKLNERYLLAKLTYELGIHIVSLGKWNLEQIKLNCHPTGRMDWISFPYEPKEYPKKVERNYEAYKSKDKIRIAVYTKEEGKRIPSIIQTLLSKAEHELKHQGINLEVLFFGLKRSYRVSIGKNLGKLSKEQMLELYRNCDFGMVASMTNISLVPYEMMATGLPVIEFSDGSFKSFFPDGCALLIDFDYKNLVNGILHLVDCPEIIEQMTRKALSQLDGLSWKNSASEFSGILQSTLKQEKSKGS